MTSEMKWLGAPLRRWKVYIVGHLSASWADCWACWALPAFNKLMISD